MKQFALAALCAGISLAVALPATAAPKGPAVVRPSFDLGGHASSGGTAFFIRVDNPIGFAAVGTAHGFDLDLLTQADHVQFDLGHTARRVALSRRLLVPPGRSFLTPGAVLRDDFNIYALEEAPQGARVLELSSRSDLTLGARIRILGIPQTANEDESEVFGRVAELSRTHIEVDLDIPFDLRGWGGAPCIDPRDGKVVGILQASSSQGSIARVSLGPISGVRDALNKMLDDGAGLPFARFAGEAESRLATRPARRRRSPRKARNIPTRSGPLLAQQEQAGTNVHLEVDFPQDGATIRDSLCGAFISGRALAHHGELRRFDVMIVIDTSQSTADLTGSDINGNGIVGRPRLGKIDSIFAVGSTDPGDSILSAEVAAARQLLRGLDPRSTRVGVVRFAGEPPGSGGSIFSRGPRSPAITLEPLTDDYARIEMALNNLLLHDPAGNTHIAAGVDQATVELTGLPGSLSTKDEDSEKVVFFFTDGQPTLPYGPSFGSDNVRAVLRAANRAQRMGVRIHSFAIGPDALEGPIATIEMASRTGGYFTPVRHPGDLVDVVDDVSFANLSDVRVHNRTTDKDADPFRTTADGTWGGFIKLEPGKNLVEIMARADDGTEAKTTLALVFEPEAPEQDVPRDLMVQRNRLLEDCLVNLKRVRMVAEEERNQQIRRELKIEIERERQKARRRAEEQRKELQLGVEEDPSP
ncbi:MAG: VWA domain-containing protein [Myxococcota bacterium]